MLPATLSPRTVLAGSLALALAGCNGAKDDHHHETDSHGSESDGTDSAGTDSAGTGTTTDSGTGTTGSPGGSGMAWYFGTDPGQNEWLIGIVDPADPSTLVDEMAIDDLAALSGPEGNDAGPGWGDATLSTDRTRIFANAASVNKVAVFEVETMSLEAILDVGERPLHLENPNHGTEMWSHADGEGAFYVIDQTSLSVSEPVVAALNDTGHGKLLYAEALGEKYYATNTSDPGAFVLDGAAKTDGTYIELCAKPCEDDPMTPEDESENTCGSTHDKAYNPTLNLAIFQCSGDTGGTYAFVDAGTDTVTDDLVEITGGIAHPDDWSYILVIDGAAGVQIWDTSADGHDGKAFDAVVPVGSGPSDRGTMFQENENGDLEAWVPQSEGTKVVVVNLATTDTEEVEIGTLTPPDGAAHFSRRSGLGGGYFFNANDNGAVVVDVLARTVTEGAATPAPSRIVFVPGS